MSDSPHRDPSFLAEGTAVLERMRDLAPSLVYVSLLTDDGFELVRVPETRNEHDRLASMASSIQALSEAVARELRVGASNYVIIEAERGRMIQRRVPAQPLVLAAVFDDDEMLGKALSSSRGAADDIAALLP